MISILIPCYNFNITELVQEIHKQTKKTNKKFEIICAEDGSNKIFSNPNIKRLQNVKYLKLKKNIGRSKIRNFLATEATFNSLLFIDCDSKIENENFIEKYINQINNEKKIVYGQTIYEKQKPKKEQILHWKYGIKIESKRKKNIFSSHHFLIQKNIFKKVKFNENIKNYGHEDTIFWVELKKENFQFDFIENPLTHIGLETNERFLTKTKTALENLTMLNKKYDLKNISIIKTHKKLSQFLLENLMIYTFKVTEKMILKNLFSENPSMLLFQFYKLGYYCTITKEI